jgi:glycosyltransferase involved in cell wall biosynthesis
MAQTVADECSGDASRAAAPSGVASPRRETITAYVYTRNEERNIADCIASVAWCDEVLVVDDFSTDRTAEIARGLGARVLEHRFEGFREQSQFALEQVRSEWALSLDADERVSPALKGSIEDMLAAPDPDVNGYRLGRVTRHLGVLFRYGTLFKGARRLARTKRCRWVGFNPHCTLSIEGAIGELAGDFLHFRDRSLQSQAEVYNRYSTLKADEMDAAGRRAGAASILLRPFGRFLRSYVVKQGFRHGTAGLVAAMEEAVYDFYKYAKLWEKRGSQRAPHESQSSDS